MLYLVAGTDLEKGDLVSVIKGDSNTTIDYKIIVYNNSNLNSNIAAKASGNQVLFNNAAQVWNHTFYW